MLKLYLCTFEVQNSLASHRAVLVNAYLS